MKIILWSEFPAKVDWKKAKALFRSQKLKADIYVASRNLNEFKKWKRKIQSKELSVGAWPILSKKEGYWFSGFCSKKSIDKLNEFSNVNIKIDLEAPFPTGNYTDLKSILYVLNLIFKKGRNSDYLTKTIDKLSKRKKILVNEFPFPKAFLKKSGIYYDFKSKRNVTKNIMIYSTISPLLKNLLRQFARKTIKKCGDRISFSIGLIGSGILKTEKAYKNIQMFEDDLKFVKSIGAKTIAIYSVDSIMAKGSSASEWLGMIKEYQK